MVKRKYVCATAAAAAAMVMQCVACFCTIRCYRVLLHINDRIWLRRKILRLRTGLYGKQHTHSLTLTRTRCAMTIDSIQLNQFI